MSITPPKRMQQSIPIPPGPKETGYPGGFKMKEAAWDLDNIDQVVIYTGKDSNGNEI